MSSDGAAPAANSGAQTVSGGILGAGGGDPLDDMNVSEELSMEMKQKAAEDIEYERIQARLAAEIGKTDARTEARVQSIVLNPNDDPIDDPPEVVEDVIKAIVGDPKDWNSAESVDFFRLVTQQTKTEWAEFQRHNPTVTKGEATRALPPRYFAPPLPPAQMESLVVANKSPVKPNVGVIRARIHYRYKDGQSYSMLREFTFTQSASSAIQEVVERVQTVLSLPSYGSPPAIEFMFKVLGSYEFLYGSEQLINFRFIRNQIQKGMDVELHVSRLPFPSSVLTAPRFTPSFGLGVISPTTGSTIGESGGNNNINSPIITGSSNNNNNKMDDKLSPSSPAAAGSPTTSKKGAAATAESGSLMSPTTATSGRAGSTESATAGGKAGSLSAATLVAAAGDGPTMERRKKQRRVGLTSICASWDEDEITAEPLVSVWENVSMLELQVNELRNLTIPVQRIIEAVKMDSGPLNLITSTVENAFVCVVVEITFGGERLAPPERTSWTLCPSLLCVSGTPVPSTAMFNTSCSGRVVFDLPLSDLPREVRICCSVVGVRQMDFASVKDVAPERLVDEVEGTAGPGAAARFAAYLGLGPDESEKAEAAKKAPVFFIAGVNFQLLDHRGHLKRGQNEVRMWNTESRWNSIGVSSSNPDLHAPAMRLKLPDFAVPIVHPEDVAPPPFKTREMEFVHYENMRNLEISIRDNKIAQLRMVKNVLATDPLYVLSPAEKVLLWHFRHDLIRRPRALPKLLLAIDWRRPSAVHEGHELMINWAPMKPIDALELLDSRFADTKVRQYAVSRLDTMPDYELANVLLQLVQVLKYEPYHYSSLARFLLRRALQSPQVIGHEFFWHLKAEMYNTAVSERHGLLLITYIRELQMRRDLLRQYSVDRMLLRVAMEVKMVKKHERLDFLRTKLDKLRFPPSFALALNPTMKCSGLEVFKCKVMDSKKLPLWLVFRNADPAGKSIYVIFKAGDDLRQDLLTLQLLQLFSDLWQSAGLDLRMIPYGCVATGDGTGMIEVVLKSDTIAHITRTMGGGPAAAFSPEPLMAWLRKFNKTPANVETCLWNFLFSSAGYAVATNVLGIGDRHNDNIMLRENGNLFHIDFGHFLGNFKSKLGFKRETAPFVFTKMMAHMLGGPESTIYAHFQDVACYAFNVIRRHANLLITLFMLMLSTGIPELQTAADIGWLKQVLITHLDDAEAAAEFRKRIQEALENKRTLLNDYVHILAHS